MESREFGRLLTNIEDFSQKYKYDSMMKPTKPSLRKQLHFSHFAPRLKVNLSDCEVFALAFNRDGTLMASSLQNGSLQIVSTMLGDKLYTIKDEKMRFPIT